MNKQVDEVRGTGRPTMKDVASKAGVALKTVSRVVNGEPGVTAATASRVLGAIEDLGFRRNESARLLRTGQTATLGFIASDWTDPDHAAVYQGLEEVARSNGYLLYSGSTDRDLEREEQLALAMCARRVDGLVVIPTPGSHDYLVSEIEAGVAAVFVLRPPAWAGDRGPSADAVLPDERGGGRGGGGAPDRAGAPADRVRPRRPEQPPGSGAAGRLHRRDDGGRADDRPGLDHADRRAAAARTGHRRPLRRPHADGGGAARAGGRRTDQPAIVGFGDFALADLVSPPVSVLVYDSVLIGRTAGELLIRRLAGEEAPPRTVHVPVRLITR